MAAEGPPQDRQEQPALEATLSILAPVARDIGVTRLANITGLDIIGLPVWTAVRPTSRALATSQGKGLSHLQARVGALMESRLPAAAMSSVLMRSNVFATLTGLRRHGRN